MFILLFLSKQTRYERNRVSFYFLLFICGHAKCLSQRNLQNIVPQCPPCLYLRKHCFWKDKMLRWYSNNYKLKNLILFSQRVTCNDILSQGLEELHFTEEWREIKVVITAVRNTHFVVYWLPWRKYRPAKGRCHSPRCGNWHLHVRLLL